MRKRKKKRIYHILLLIIFVVILLAFLIASFTSKTNKFTSFVKDTVISTENVLLYPFRYILDKIDDYKNLKNINEKYEMLLSKVDRIDALEAENIELRKQLESMKKELNITYTINGYEYLPATIISRNVGYWYNTITINKGSHHGITKDMVVVNNSGLIGRVVSTTAFTSDVRLITTSDTISKISVSISNGKVSVNGLLKGYNYKTNYLEVEAVSSLENIGYGYYVYTSGLGGVFPSGILIGKVEDVVTDEYDLVKQANVKPAADFNDLNYVAVLKRKEEKHD